jgi:hypothetical protein
MKGDGMKAVAAALGVALMAAGCSTLTVSSDWDHSVDFSQYKTFGLREGTKAQSSIVQNRIDSAVTATLVSKGLTPADDPSLLVYTHTSVSREKQVNYDNFGYGGWYGWDGWGTGGWAATSATVQEVPIGTVTVDLVDANKKTLVWRGTATETVTSDDTDSQAKIDEAAAKLFQNFPPRAGK